MMLDLTTARAIVDGALVEARARRTSPLAVIVLDAGGHPIAFVREDGASLFRFDIARAKALGALGMGSDTRELAARAANHSLFYTTVAVATDGRIALSPGGVLVRAPDGAILGAVGISGDTGDVDEACAFAGIVAAGLHHGRQG